MILRESNVSIENCAFYGFRQGIPGSDYATAITATGFEEGEGNLRVVGCTFADSYVAFSLLACPSRKA